MAQPALPARADPADAVAIRVIAEDLSLSPGDWVAVTPPRVPEVRSVQEYIGPSSRCCWTGRSAWPFPCQRPMLHANGVTEVPKFRISPDYFAKLQSTDTWQNGLEGGLLGITDLLLRRLGDVDLPVQRLGAGLGSLRGASTPSSTPNPPCSIWAVPRMPGLYSPGEIRIGP